MSHADQRANAIIIQEMDRIIRARLDAYASKSDATLLRILHDASHSIIVQTQPDASWIYSSIAQSCAALIGIIAALFILFISQKVDKNRRFADDIFRQYYEIRDRILDMKVHHISVHEMQVATVNINHPEIKENRNQRIKFINSLNRFLFLKNIKDVGKVITHFQVQQSENQAYSQIFKAFAPDITSLAAKAGQLRSRSLGVGSWFLLLFIISGTYFLVYKPLTHLWLDSGAVSLLKSMKIGLFALTGALLAVLWETISSTNLSIPLDRQLPGSDLPPET